MHKANEKNGDIGKFTCKLYCYVFTIVLSNF